MRRRTTSPRCVPARAARSVIEPFSPPDGYAARVNDETAPTALAQQAADRLRDLTGVEKHDVALVMGSGWLPAVDALGEATAELEHHGPAGLRPPGRRGARRQDPVGPDR